MIHNIGESSTLARDKKPRFFYGYTIVLACLLVMMLVHGAYYTFGVFLKPLIAEFGWSRAAISSAYSLSMILQGIYALVVGRLNDRFGPRVIVTICGFLFGLGYILMSQISALWQLYLIYAVMIAAGTTGGWLPMLSTVARWFSKRRGLMTGVVISGIGLGTVTIPPLSGWLITAYDWRTAYIILGIIMLVSIIIAAQFLRRDPGQMGMMPDGVKEEPKNGIDVGEWGFSLQQALRKKQLWIICTLFLCFGIFLDTIITHIVPHITEFGVSVTAASSVLAAIGGVGIVGRLTLGSASDRVGSRVALIVAFIVMIFALLWLQLARELWMFYLFAAVYGFAYGGMGAMQSTTVAEYFGVRSHGEIFGIITFATTIGEAIGPLMAGRIFDVVKSYQPAFLILAVFSVIGLVLTVLLKPIASEKPVF